jgi:hypothetical protein
MRRVAWALVAIVDAAIGVRLLWEFTQHPGETPTPFMVASIGGFALLALAGAGYAAWRAWTGGTHSP